jgi:hypothetical protein
LKAGGLKMAICQKCLKEYEDRETRKNPMEELTHIFLKSVKGYDADRLFPDCKEELGIINLLGFDE